MKYWVIRTKDGKVVIFDEEIQRLPSGEMTEFTFTDKEVAQKVLIRVSVIENTTFELVEKEVQEKDIAWTMDEKDVHDRAIEEAKIRRGENNA